LALTGTSNPGVLASFAGLNHFQQRFGSTAGPNQFSLEPPDQGLCVGNDGNGNTRVLEVVNDVMRVYTTSGAAVTAPTALNGFLGYAPAIIRSPKLTFGPDLHSHRVPGLRLHLRRHAHRAGELGHADQ